MSTGERAREARDRYFRASGLGTAAYAERRFPVRVGPITLPFPNPAVLPLHDLHHVATGFAPDFFGEAEISAFELRAGGAPALVRFLCVGSLLLALPLAPRRILRAWRRSRGTCSLYDAGHDAESLLGLEVSALRALLRLPVGGISETRERT